MFIENRTRSIIKTLSWRLVATITTVVLVYIFTGQVKTALTVGGIEVFAKMAIYYFHERFWDRIKFGRREVQASVIWVTGLPGSGKGLLSNKIVEYLKSKEFKVETIDGSAIRQVIPEIGFDKEQRFVHICRVGLLASKLENNGIFVVANFVSPDTKGRDFVRKQCKNFIEVYVSTPLEVCKNSDHKNIYEMAAQGKIENYVGVHFPYEESANVEFKFDLSNTNVDLACEEIIKHIEKQI